MNKNKTIELARELYDCMNRGGGNDWSEWDTLEQSYKDQWIAVAIRAQIVVSRHILEDIHNSF